MDDTATGFGALMLLLILYFLPTIVASGRHHANTAAIFALNLLTGWTGLGWVAAMVWSLTSNRRAA